MIPRFEDLVRVYKGQKHHEIRTCGLSRRLPVVSVSEGIWIASNAQLVFGDVEFIVRAGEKLAEAISRFDPELLLVPEAKCVAIAHEVARNLSHDAYAVARKGTKAYMDSAIEEAVESITTKEPQRLVLDGVAIKRISGRRIALIDDAVSTGGTIRALENLTRRANGKIVCKAAVWLEGASYSPTDLVFLSTLPLFVRVDLYRGMLSRYREGRR